MTKLLILDRDGTLTTPASEGEFRQLTCAHEGVEQ